MNTRTEYWWVQPKGSAMRPAEVVFDDRGIPSSVKTCGFLYDWAGTDITFIARIEEPAISAERVLTAAQVADSNRDYSAVSYKDMHAPKPIGTALDDIAAERRRQVEAEGWTPEHDDAHTEGEMAAAASCYALATVDGRKSKMLWLNRAQVPLSWPWDAKWWKPGDPRRDLVKAGALVVAEIERIDRATAATATEVKL